MSEEKNKGAAPTPPPAPPKSRFTNSKTSGIEPGRLNGGRREFKPQEEEIPEDVKLKRKIAKFSAAEFKAWLQEDPANARRLRELNITK